jgi:hypothetical protein
VSTRSLTPRVTHQEDHAIRGYCKIVKYTFAQLMEMAVVETMHRMGIFTPLDVIGRELHWPDAPRRKTTSVQTRLTANFTPAYFDLAQDVAKAAGTTMSLFVIGCTMRYIATRKKLMGSISPELAELELPAQYE